MREFRGKVALVVSGLYVAFVLWSLYGAVQPVETYTFRMVHLLFIFILAFLVMPVSPKAGRWGLVLDLGLAALGAAAVIYALVDVDGFMRRSTVPGTLDFIFGLAAILLLVELSRRSVGNTFTICLGLFLAYAYLGYLIPAPLGHKGYDLDRIVGHLYMTLEGVFGTPISVSASFVILFVVFGTFMDVAGASKFWMELSLAVMGRGPASAGRGTVVTSALLGGPQGSGVATTMSVAPIMWPILKNAGYSANMAAGLVAAGGIGAVISPPLMGAAAFLIMQFLNVSFWDVVVMVILPTLLYYLGTLFMVEFEARKYNFKPPDTPDFTVWQVLKNRGYHLISLAVLVVLLSIGLSSEVAALWAIAAVIATSYLSKDRAEWLTPRRILVATIESAKNMLPVAVLLAAAGLIVGVFSLTGLGLKISTLIMSASGGNLLLALLLALVASMLIGLSLPITATYIMTVVMVAPALVQVGVPEYVAHLLVFYFAVLSEVSPPVGLSPSAAAAVTGGDPFGSMMEAWKYSLPAFLVPFLFSANAQGASLLLVHTTLGQFIPALLNSLLALFFLAIGIVGYWRAGLHWLERAILIAVSVWMVVFPLEFAFLSLVAPVIALAVIGRHFLATRRVI